MYTFGCLIKEKCLDIAVLKKMCYNFFVMSFEIAANSNGGWMLYISLSYNNSLPVNRSYTVALINQAVRLHVKFNA